MKSIVCVAMAALIVLGAGCAKKATPKSTYESMVETAKTGDKEAVLAYFDEETRQYIAELEKFVEDSGMGGDKGFDEMLAKVKDAKIEFGQETIDGEKATLNVTIDGKSQNVAFVKKDGQWKISIPELKQMAEMMKGLSRMAEQMKKSKGLGDDMKKALEGLKKK